MFLKSFLPLKNYEMDLGFLGNNGNIACKVLNETSYSSYQIVFLLLFCGMPVKSKLQLLVLASEPQK